MQVKWMKCQGQVWCKLATVDLNHSHFASLSGVYIIWHGGAAPTTVYVGQGSIADSLRSRRTDPQVQQYNSHGLYVTWAAVDPSDRLGVQSYLINKLRPKVTADISASQIEVNLPW